MGCSEVLWHSPHRNLDTTPSKVGADSSTHCPGREGAWTWDPAANKYQALGWVLSGSSLESQGAEALALSATLPRHR